MTKTVYVMIAGSQFCTDNDRLLGYVTDKAEAERHVREGNAKKDGHHYSYQPIGKFKG